jgi:hypothetical protein
MGKVIEVDFEKNSLTDEQRFIGEVQPILQDLVDVARHNFGSITAIDILTDVMGILYNYTEEERYVLTMENGDIIDFTLDTIG